MVDCKLGFFSPREVFCAKLDHMLLAQKIALSLLILGVAFAVLLVIAYSFALGNTVQNILIILDLALSGLWLYFTWRGWWVRALSGVISTLIVGVVVIPFLAR
jgi:hypothetical protein